MNPIKKFLPEITSVLFLLIYFAWGMVQLNALQFNGWDYGIFQQSLYDIAAGLGFNPLNTIRGIYIFNEHFYPILIPFAYFTRLLGYSVWSPFFIEWASVAATLIFILWALKKESVFVKTSAILSIIFCRSILTAITFPVHTDTWALPLQVFIIYGLSKNNFKLIFISSFLLMFYKETYCFGIVGLSFYFLWQKRWKEFLPLFILGAFFVIMELGPRKAMLGDGNYYAQSYSKMIFFEPLKTLGIMFKTAVSGSFFKVFIAYLIPIIYLFKKASNEHKKTLIGAILYLLPLFLIHLIIERFYFHHSSLFGITLSAALMFSGFFNLIESNKKLWIIVLLPFFLTSTSTYKRMFSPIIKTVSNKVPYDAAALQSFKEARELLHDSISPDDNIFAGGGMSVFVLKPKMNIFHPASTMEMPPVFNFIALEKAPYGDLWPMTGETILHTIERCREFATQIKIENEFVFVAQGNFPLSCVK